MTRSHRLCRTLNHSCFVVDDDVSVRESLESLIRYAGWQVETFTSAQEFLSRPRVLVPSCLILDVSLPGLNGLDLKMKANSLADLVTMAAKLRVAPAPKV
jgi:DNA-binding response OmpR family regulator